MLTSDLADLKSVVTRIRIEAYPWLDDRFITAVLQAEAEAAGNDSAALQAIRRAIEEALEIQSP